MYSGSDVITSHMYSPLWAYLLKVVSVPNRLSRALATTAFDLHRSVTDHPSPRQHLHLDRLLKAREPSEAQRRCFLLPSLSSPSSSRSFLCDLHRLLCRRLRPLTGCNTHLFVQSILKSSLPTWSHRSLCSLHPPPLPFHDRPQAPPSHSCLGPFAEDQITL